MTFGVPLFLVLLIPLGAAAWVVTQGRSSIASRLPGGWGAVADAPLRRHLAKGAATGRNRAPLVALAISAMLVLALARPGGDAGGVPDYTGVAGRVIVLDATVDPARQILFVREIQDATPRIPTAIVLAAADAYLIVPFTTDPAQIHRYLSVLTPDMMPGDGRRLHLGLAWAEEALARAGYPAGQIILTSDGPPPQPVAIAPTQTIRTIAALTDTPDDWRDFANVYGADLIDGQDGATASDALIARAEDEIETTLPGARFALAPWLIGLAMALYLILFRRRAT